LSRATGKLVLVTIQSVVASLSGPFGAGALSKMHRLKQTPPDETQKKFVNWLVCGDLVEVGEGQQVPVDCRIIKIKSTRLSADQSVLTGESQPSSKEEHPGQLKGVLQVKTCICFSGCPLTRGCFQGIVSAVSSNSEIGKIHKAVTGTSEQETPLQISLDKFGDVISKGILVICLITWVANIINFEKVGKGNWWLGAISFFKIAISFAVAAIPEGLPAVVTTALSYISPFACQRKVKSASMGHEILIR
jgi:Ca2+ transporting ATPase